MIAVSHIIEDTLDVLAGDFASIMHLVIRKLDFLGADILGSLEHVLVLCERRFVSFAVQPDGVSVVEVDADGSIVLVGGTCDIAVKLIYGVAILSYDLVCPWLRLRLCELVFVPLACLVLVEVVGGDLLPVDVDGVVGEIAAQVAKASSGVRRGCEQVLRVHVQVGFIIRHIRGEAIVHLLVALVKHGAFR